MAFRAIVGTNIRVSVQSASGSPITITALTNANPGEASAAAHGLADGDVVVFTVEDGMVELHGQAARVAGSTTGTFELEGIDTTDFSVWTTGTAAKASTFEVVKSARAVNAPQPAPTKLDSTTLLDKFAKQYVYALPDAPDGTIDCFFNPLGAAEQLVRTASQTHEDMVIKVEWLGQGLTMVTNAQVSGGEGFAQPGNDTATTTISFTPRNNMMYFGS